MIALGWIKNEIRLKALQTCTIATTVGGGSLDFP